MINPHFTNRPIASDNASNLDTAASGERLFVMTNCSECHRLREQTAALFSDYTLRRDELAMTRKNDKAYAATIPSIGLTPIFPSS